MRIHDLEGPWLTEKAKLMDAVAVDRDDLPVNFGDVLLSLFDIVPQRICELLNILPLNYMDDILIVGMSEVHPGVLAILKELSGYTIEPRIMYDSLIEYWLGKTTSNVPSNTEIGSEQVRAFLLASHLVQPDQLIRLDVSPKASIKETFAALQSAGLLSDDDVAQVYAILFQTPYLSLINFQAEDRLISRFSQSFLKENKLLPLMEFEDTLWVATADPLDGQPLAELAKVSEMSIWPLVVPNGDLDRIMRRFINYAKTDRSNEYVKETLDYLVKQKVIAARDLPEILSDIFDKDQAFDRVIRKYALDPEMNIYRKFAKARDISFVSLKKRGGNSQPD